MGPDRFSAARRSLSSLLVALLSLAPLQTAAAADERDAWTGVSKPRPLVRFDTPGLLGADRRTDEIGAEHSTSESAEKPAVLGARVLNAEGRLPAEGPIRASLRRIPAAPAERFSRSGSSAAASRGSSHAGWVGFMVVSLGAGAGLGFYGVSDRCVLSHPGTTTCDTYRNTGIAIMLGGLAVGILGAALSGQEAPDPQPAGGVGQAPPPVPIPLPAPSVPSMPTSSAPTNLVPNDAEARAARQAIDEINAAPHGTVPAPRVTGRCSGSVAHMSITNSTAYQLLLYLSGPQGRTLSIAPSGTANVQVQAGYYAVGARVSAPNVRPFSGGWQLEGCPYVSQFYVGQ